MTKSIIHIGYHKTATTFFQKNVYPKVKNANYVDRYRARNAICAPYAFDFKKDEAQRILGLSSAEPVIICEEELSGNIHTGGARSFLSKAYADRLKETFEDANILIFIRNQREIIRSAYVEYIKDGGTFSLKRYIKCKNSVRRFCFTLQHFDFIRLIDYYSNLFGKNNVKVYLFEDFINDIKSFLLSFMDDMSLCLNVDDIALHSENVSFKKNTLNLLRFSNIFTSRYLLHKYYLAHVSPIHRMLSSPFLVGLSEKVSNKKINVEHLFDKELSYVSDFYREGNRILASKYKLPLEEYNYPL